LTTGIPCPALTEYFNRLDGPRPKTALELLAPDFRFATIWADESCARPFGGGRAELQAYFGSRDARGQRHYLLDATSSDAAEIASGYTTRHGTPLASFLITIRLDESGLIRRMMSARTTALSLLD
jgi:hypothetical protein